MPIDALKKLIPAASNNGTASAPAAGAYIPNPELRNEDRVIAPEFPFEVFPERIRRIIEDCHQFLSYPRDFTACGILAAGAIAIARTCNAAYQWDEYSTLYMAVVAPPGTAKTHLS